MISLLRIISYHFSLDILTLFCYPWLFFSLLQEKFYLKRNKEEVPVTANKKSVISSIALLLLAVGVRQEVVYRGGTSDEALYGAVVFAALTGVAAFGAIALRAPAGTAAAIAVAVAAAYFTGAVSGTLAVLGALAAVYVYAVGRLAAR